MAILSADYSNLNYEDMAKAIGLKPKHMPMLVASFIEESEPTLKVLASSIEAKDYVSIASLSHSIKGSAGNLRLSEVYEMTKEMEKSAKSNAQDFDYAGHLEAVKTILETVQV
jgi:HPt (histidine-containing phosphotransfer) domain-containing protein